MSLYVNLGQLMTGNDGKGTLHAVTYSSLSASSRARRKTIDSVCGVRVRLEVTENPDGDRFTLPWPPSVKAIAPERRCADCHKATGSKRPWPSWKDAA